MDNKSSKVSLLFLHEAIIEEILLRIPVRSLLRFRCVSKSWRCLIDSDRFIKNHFQTSSKNASLAHHRHFYFLDSHVEAVSDKKAVSDGDEESDSDEESHSNNEESESIHIVGCCNGLVCYWSNFGNLEKGYFELLNPATTITGRILPELELKIEDRVWSIGDCGFDWDESSGAHKVFVVLHWGNWDRMAKLYSSETNSWKTVIEVIDFENMGMYRTPVLSSGKLHWLRTHNIVTFDMKSEEFGVMERPHAPVVSLMRLDDGCLGAMCGHDYEGGWSIKYTDVRLMKEGSWVKTEDIVVYKPLVRAANVVFPRRPKIPRSHDAEIWLVRGLTFKLDDPAHDDELRNKKIQAWESYMLKTDLCFLYVESLVSPIPFNKRGNCP